MAAVVLAGLISSLGAVTSVASPSEGSDYAYAAANWQYAAWSKSAMRVRLKVSPSSSMSTDRCMDSMVDWGTEGTGHYDSRVVRSCLPGTTEETDPGGNGYWQEPSSWEGASIGGLQKGYGYLMDDDYVNGAFVVYASEAFSEAGGGAMYSTPPRTGVDGWSRVRTRYGNGTVASCNPLPARTYAFQGCS